MVAAPALVPPRFGSARHDDTPTLGPALADIGELLGVRFHAWQRHLSDVSLELAPRGDGRRLAARSVGAVVGRQSGKTSWCAARIGLQCLLPDLADVHGLVGHPVRAQHVAFTAQDRTAALARWHEHVDWLMSSPLAAQVGRVVLQRGDEQVQFVNGSTYKVVTPSRTGARGASFDLCIIDEALTHELWLLSAMAPTMAQRDGATGCIGAQLVIVSNAGDERAELLNAERDAGRRAVALDDRRRVWCEWSAPDDADPFDESVWADAMPTLDQPDGISRDVVRMQAETLPVADFRREYLCVHTSRPVDAPLDVDAWQAAPRLDVDGNRVAFGVDASPFETAATIVVAGQAVGGDLAVEVVDHDVPPDGLVERCVELAERWAAPIVLDRLGPVAWLADALALRRVRVVTVGASDVLIAASEFANAVGAGRVAHGHDPRLDWAVRQARRRRSGDRWAFDRHTHADVSGVVAASLAVWQLNRPRRTPAIHAGPGSGDSQALTMLARR